MIYLDHAAATPVSPKALKAMEPYFTENFFNPSSPYLPATAVRQDYESAKNTIAHAIGAKGADLIVTAGATESINLAFTSISTKKTRSFYAPTVLISAVEHPAVFANAERCGNFDTIKVDQFGRIDLEDLASKITSQTHLVSITLVSGELGTIQPISEVAHLIKAERQRRLKNADKAPIYLHCDASQGLGLIDVKISRLGVDMLTLNSAKIYGPKAVAALWAGHNVKLSPLIVGGGQEFGLRSGTENVPGTIGFATAIQEAEAHLPSECKRLAKLRNQLKTALSKNPTIEFLGHPKTQLANFLPITIPGLDAERLIFKLEQQDLYISTGAACSASKGIKSPTLGAIGLTDSQIAGSLRLTLGKLNDETNIAQAATILLSIIKKEQERTHGKN